MDTRVSPSSRAKKRASRIALKKQRKASYFTSSAPSGHEPGAKRLADSSNEHSDSPVRKRARHSQDDTRKPTASNPVTVFKSAATAERAPTNSKPKQRQQSALQRLADRTASMPVPRTQAERDEDAYIAHLEAKLGMGQRSKKGGEGFEDDGLDGKLGLIQSGVRLTRHCQTCLMDWIRLLVLDRVWGYVTMLFVALPVDASHI